MSYFKANAKFDFGWGFTTLPQIPSLDIRRLTSKGGKGKGWEGEEARREGNGRTIRTGTFPSTSSPNNWQTLKEYHTNNTVRIAPRYERAAVSVAGVGCLEQVL